MVRAAVAQTSAAAYIPARISAFACIRPTLRARRNWRACGLRAKAAHHGRRKTRAARSIRQRRSTTVSFACRPPTTPRPPRLSSRGPNIEQPYYDISNQAWRDRSFAPWPLAAWAEFTFDGVPIRLGQVVQTLERVTGPGGVYEPLVVTPAIGVRIEPEARILPLDGSPLPVKVTVHAQAAAEGPSTLKLPEGWHAEPARGAFHLKSAGDTEPLVFSVTTGRGRGGRYNVEAIAQSADEATQTGWRSVGYQGLRPITITGPRA